MTLRHIIITFLLSIFIPIGAYGFEPIPLTARQYYVYWGGIKMASMTSGIKKTEEGLYQFDTMIKSHNLAKMISKYKSTTTTILEQKENGPYIHTFHHNSKLRKRKRTIDISYNDEQMIASEAVVPPDIPGKRPPVEDYLKLHTIDPMTAAVKARQKIHAYLHGEGERKFVIASYDARRLMHLHFTIHGKTTKNVYGKDHNVVHFSFSRRPVSGFTKNELKRLRKEDPIIDVYLSDDEWLLPVMAEGKALIGTAVFKLKKTCQTIDEC